MLEIKTWGRLVVYPTANAYMYAESCTNNDTVTQIHSTVKNQDDALFLNMCGEKCLRLSPNSCIRKYFCM